MLYKHSVEPGLLQKQRNWTVLSARHPFINIGIANDETQHSLPLNAQILAFDPKTLCIILA